MSNNGTTDKVGGFAEGQAPFAAAGDTSFTDRHIDLMGAISDVAKQAATHQGIIDGYGREISYIGNFMNILVGVVALVAAVLAGLEYTSIQRIDNVFGKIESTNSDLSKKLDEQAAKTDAVASEVKLLPSAISKEVFILSKNLVDIYHSQKSDKR